MINMLFNTFSILFVASVLSAQETAPSAPSPPSPPTQQTLLQDDGMVRVDNFDIDIYEYPNIKGQLPTVNVTFAEAENLCAARGKRLCSEQEWQRAAVGPENFPYSYGISFESGRCNTPSQENGIWQGGASLAACGAFEQCQNTLGIHDMIGNVWEWTSSWYNTQEGWRTIRGGSYFHSANMARADARYGRYLDPEYRLDLVGFRCCRSATSPLPDAQ